MGDFRLDTTLTRTGDDEWSRRVHPDWVIWGPNGGYMAALAMRVAGELAQRPRPASVTVHFLGVASLDDPVVVTAAPQRVARNATSVRVDITQRGKPMLAAMVWAVDGDLPGLRHESVTAPEVPHWSESPTIEERFAAAGREYVRNFDFWGNFEQRPATWIPDWEARADLAPEYHEWLRFAPTAAFDDPWLEAARLLLLVDLGGWPATCQHHNQSDFIAPNIDVSCEFHSLDATDWLLLHGRADLAADGLVATRQEVWSDDGRLLASGISHLLCKPVAARA